MTKGLPETPRRLETPALDGVESSERLVEDLSSVEADERAHEALRETQDDILHAENTSAASVSPVATPNRQQRQTEKDEVIIEVEKVLEDGLGPLYASLPADAKPLFKQKGEEASREIAEMVRTFNVRVKRVLELISAWLRTIPGVNAFFLEQEGKIKTDRIVELMKARRNDE